MKRATKGPTKPETKRATKAATKVETKRATKAATEVETKPALTRTTNAARPSGKARPAAREIRLTAEVAAGGCACKLGPGDLREVLAKLPVPIDPNILVGTENADDAAVYRLSASLALVSTLDFFTPMVDDPYAFGQVAATNALSDVYAMGGRPVVALSIVAFPSGKLPMSVLLRILEGASERVKAAGAVIIGGHSVMDNELKYGLAVTGTVHPDRIVRNGGAKAGDDLILTKPLGTGIIASGIKRRVAHADEQAFAIASMTTLNDIAGGLLHRFGARACTDVTGFGLAGHGNEMAEASDSIRLEIDAGQLPLLPGTARLAEDGYVTGGSRRNREWLGRRLRLSKSLAPALSEAVLDPQTSGGLLIAVPTSRSTAFMETLHAKGLRPALIGRAAARPRGSSVTVAVA
ncbi:MAG: selenide, water dikinase SelD [Deltaproteobacteria bacterium]|nr:selenide, water dikinase SelD [Deltaproteobacteria bacterium]